MLECVRRRVRNLRTNTPLLAYAQCTSTSRTNSNKTSPNAQACTHNVRINDNHNANHTTTAHTTPATHVSRRAQLDVGARVQFRCHLAHDVSVNTRLTTTSHAPAPPRARHASSPARHASRQAALCARAHAGASTAMSSRAQSSVETRWASDRAWAMTTVCRAQDSL
jgi:hypothetical protein